MPVQTQLQSLWETGWCDPWVASDYAIKIKRHPEFRPKLRRGNPAPLLLLHLGYPPRQRCARIIHVICRGEKVPSFLGHGSHIPPSPTPGPYRRSRLRSAARPSRARRRGGGGRGAPVTCGMTASASAGSRAPAVIRQRRRRRALAPAAAGPCSYGREKKRGSQGGRD